MRKGLSAIFAVLALAGFGWGFSQHQKLAKQTFQQKRLALLEADNLRLRDVIAAQEKARGQADNLAQRAPIEKAVAGIRELNFIQPVIYDVLTREGIKRTIQQKLDEQFSNEELKNIGIGLSALGLLPRDYPLKEKYIELLGEQVAAFYDQHQHRLFMFEDAALSNAQNRIVLAHELTHALQDQHFGLLKLPLEIKTNDDRAIAASALAEGDATLVMSQFMLQNISLGALSDTVGGALSQNMRQLQDAPRYLREMLVFPYLRGQEFCTALFARGGWSEIDAAYKKPPSSSSQILHVEKYLAEPREEPLEIAWSEMTVNGEKPLADNVLGEMGTRILLAETSNAKIAETAADGWRGDRYLVFAHGDALVWKTAWASARDAREFADALQPYVKKHYGDAAKPELEKLLNEIILRPTNEVVLIHAATKEWAAALHEKFAP